MSGRDRLSKRDSFWSKPKPENNILQSRPFAPRKPKSVKKKEPADIQAQLEKEREFGYNAAKIPTFAPTTPPPIEPEFSVDEQLNQDEEEKETPELGESQEIIIQREQTPQGELNGEITPLEKEREFGYNAAKIPTFAPTTPPPIEPEFSVDEQLNQDEEEEAEVSAPDGISSVQRVTVEDAPSQRNDSPEKPALAENQVLQESITDIGELPVGKIQPKSHPNKTESPPDILVPLKLEQLSLSSEEIANFSFKESHQNLSYGGEEERFLQPQKISEIPLIYQQAKESHEPIVQRQPSPLGESQAEMTPEERLAESNRLNNLGLVEERKENYLQALRYYQEASELIPHFSLYWYNSGVALLKMGRNQDAINSYETALGLNNNWHDATPSDAWHNRGVALERLWRYDQALQSYQQAIKVDPTNTETQNNLSNLEKLLAENPSLRNQNQQTPETDEDDGNNIIETLMGRTYY